MGAFQSQDGLGLEHVTLDAELEIRQGGRTLSGRFPYNSMAITSDRAARRKERISSRAFSFAVEDPAREVNLLHGHSFSRPLASKLAGTLELRDTDKALEFTATLPVEGEQPTWVRDTVLGVEAGLIRGVSPGFRIPPPDMVPNAERLVPEPGNPGVFTRVINQALLFELSLVARAIYKATSVDLRSLEAAYGRPEEDPQRWWALWL